MSRPHRPWRRIAQPGRDERPHVLPGDHADEHRARDVCGVPDRLPPDRRPPPRRPSPRTPPGWGARYRPTSPRAGYPSPSALAKLSPTGRSAPTPSTSSTVAPRSANVARVPRSTGPPATLRRAAACAPANGRSTAWSDRTRGPPSGRAAHRRPRRALRAGVGRAPRSRRRTHRDRCGGRTSSRSPPGS